MRIVALAGGTGSAKLLRGLGRTGVDLTVVANVGDNAWMYGVYVCPDIDVACYSLAGVSDAARGWGVAGDTFEVLESLTRLGVDTWFRLGDRDLATCLRRTSLLRSGATLTEATEAERRSLGVNYRVLPASDDPIETRVATPDGDLGLQEFWVREKGLPSVERVWFRGSRKARVTPEVRSAIGRADRIIVCPANPVSSIGPMLAVPGFAKLLADSDAPVVALSPMRGSSPFSGPAGKMLRAAGVKPDSAGVAALYARFLDGIIVAEEDSGLEGRIRSLGVRCTFSDTLMRSPADEIRLAWELMHA